MSGRYADASPIRHVSPADPPMLLIHGDADSLVPVDQSRRLATALADAGVPHQLIVIPDTAHGFDFQVGSRDLLPDMIDFLAGVWDNR